MSQHRKSTKSLVNPLLGGAVLAAGAMMAVSPLASAAPAAGGRPDVSFPQPGVNAIQNVGDPVFDNPNIKIPTLRAQGPVTLNDTGAGQTYHALFGNSVNTLQRNDDGSTPPPGQGLTVGVLNTFGTTYKVRCNIVVQTRCGTSDPQGNP